MSTKSNKDSFLKGAFILGVAGIIVKIIGAFFRIPLGNLIGAEGMGYYQAAYPVYVLFLTLATAGFPTALAKLVSEKIAFGDYAGAHKVFKVSHNVLFITGIVAFCIFFFGAKFIVEDILHNPNAYYAMLAIAPSLLFVPVMSSYRGYFQGRREMTPIALSQINEQFIRVILGLGLAYIFMSTSGSQLGAAGAISGATFGALAAMIFLIWVYFRKNKIIKGEIKSGKKFKPESNWNILNKLLVIAVPITIGACVIPLVNTLDSIIVIRRLEVAGYSYEQANALFGQLTGMAMSIINMPSVITTSLSMSLVPAISQSYAIGDLKTAQKEIKTGVKVTLYMVLPAAFGLASLATPIMHLLFPNEPASIGTILFVLTPAVVFLGLIQTLTGALQGMGKPMIPVLGLALGMVFKAVMSYVLTAIPQINVVGSALGTIIAYLIAAVVDIYYVKKFSKVKFPVKEFIFKPFTTVIVMSLVVVLSYMGLQGLLGGKLATVISIAIGACVYFIMIFAIGGISKEELLKMPKGNKLYKILKKVKLMR